MFKVFLVEDETVVREGLRRSIPWEQHGFSYIGDATDGELALPMIRHQPPDLLITDINMPFMNGLELSRQVHEEFPQIKIILITGHMDFRFAKEAIEIGVDQYLVKPITKTVLLPVLDEIAQVLESEQAHQANLDSLQQEASEYARFTRTRFFEHLVSGRVPASTLYNEAAALELDLKAPCYSMVLYLVQPRNPRNEQDQARLDAVQQELDQFFLRCPQFLLFQWSIGYFAVVVQADERRIQSETDFCVQNIRRRFDPFNDIADWYVSVGTPVNRLSGLSECFQEACRILSYRHLCVGQHELRADSLEALNRSDTEQRIAALDPSLLSTAPIMDFLKNGGAGEAAEFAKQYLNRFGEEALGSVLFCQHLMLTIRFAAAAYVEEMHMKQTELLRVLDNQPPVDQLFGRDNVQRYITALLARGLELRDSVMQPQYHGAVTHGLRYIDQHFSEPTLSLQTVAGYVGVSPNYFSALFSQDIGCTFVEYLTGKRMERAKELLRTSRMRTSEIAAAVGYKDSHYFSHLFRKTQNCTPSAYRSSGG